MKISKKQIVDIREFIRNYYSLECNWSGKLSHKRMEEFLSVKGKMAVKVNIDSIKNENILCGTYIFVKDEEGKIIPYKNNLRLRFNADKIKTEKTDYNALRLQLLEEQGLTYDEKGKVITIEEKNRRLEYKKIQEQIVYDQIEQFYEKMAMTNRQLTLQRKNRGCIG